jgi:hypothetical protein
MDVESQFSVYDIELEALSQNTNTGDLNIKNIVLWFTDEIPRDINNFYLVFTIGSSTEYNFSYISKGYESSNNFIGGSKNYARFFNGSNSGINFVNVSAGTNIKIDVYNSGTYIGKWEGSILIKAGFAS